MSEMFRQLKCNNSLINVGQCHGCFSSVWLLVSFLIFWTPCSIVMSTLVSVLTPRSDPVILLSAHLGSRPDIETPCNATFIRRPIRTDPLDVQHIGSRPTIRYSKDIFANGKVDPKTILYQRGIYLSIEILGHQDNASNML